MEIPFFNQLAILLGTSAIMSVILAKLKLPVFLGFIASGVILKFVPGMHLEGSYASLLGHIGLALLLFILGLELSGNDVRNLGKTALFLTVINLIVTGTVTYVLIGFGSIPVNSSVYIAIALSFSSPLIVVKLLSQRKSMESLYGRISLNAVVLSDVVASVIILGLHNFIKIDSSEIATILMSSGLTLLKGAIFFILALYVARHVIEPVLDSIRDQKEIMYVLVIAWTLLLASIASSEYIGFSLELGALVAGISLADRLEHFQIESWMKSLRDFCLVAFFALLGFRLQLENISSIIVPVLGLSLAVILIKFLCGIFIMKSLGYSKRTSFFTALYLAQVSEYTLGYNPLNVGNETITLITLVMVCTMIASSLLSAYGEPLYLLFKPLLDSLSFKKHPVDDVLKKERFEIVLIGCHRIGNSLLHMFKKSKKRLLVIDHDPNLIKTLTQRGYHALYGDLNDEDFLETCEIDKASIVISTIPTLKENRKLLHYLNDVPNNPMILITANEDEEARELYELGADFVVYPHLLGGELLNSIVEKGVLTKRMVAIRNKHRELLDRL